MLNARRKLVLKALVEEYIRSGEPVGSRVLVERHGISCSPATVRNELAALEESGHVFQPHVSSGRVPTDAGYRAFVDGLLESGEPLPALDADTLPVDHLDLASEVDDLMRRTSTVLAHLTHYVAVVLAPTVSLARIRRIDLVPMGPSRALVVLITSTGQVVNRHIDLAEQISPDRLAEIERALNAAFGDKHASEVRALRGALESEALDRSGSARASARGEATPDRSALAAVLDEILDCLNEADRDRLYHVGVPELLELPEFAESARLRPLLGLLEDGFAMLETLSDFVRTGGLTVRIGSENTRRELGEMSVVMTNYSSSDANGVVGVIGPTRMDYPRTIAAVRRTADGLTDVLR